MSFKWAAEETVMEKFREQLPVLFNFGLEGHKVIPPLLNLPKGFYKLWNGPEDGGTRHKNSFERDKENTQTLGANWRKLLIVQWTNAKRNTNA